MVECCNTPHVTCHICNSDSCHFRLCDMFSLRCRVLSFVLYFVMSCIFISCHHAHYFCICVRLMHPSIFPVVRFPIRRSYLLRCTPLVFFRVRVSNILGMDRGLSSGLRIPPGDHRSSFVPFGGRLVLLRLTGHPQSPSGAQNQPNSLPCSRSFDHDRVGENRTSFGAS